MGRKTTTTYQITVSHNGPLKDNIWKVLNIKGRTSLEEWKIIETETVKTDPVPAYSDELKLIRSFIKACCGKLQYEYKNSTDVKAGQYNIKYGHTRGTWPGHDTVRVTLCKKYLLFFDFYFPENSVGKVDIHSPKVPKDKYKSHWENYLVEDFDIADPKAEDNLLALLEKW